MIKKTYKKNFLSEVIIRADFLSEVTGLRKQLPSGIGEAIKEEFPIPETKDVVKFPINVKLGKQKITGTEFTEWSFHTKDRKNTLTIIKDAVFIKISRYESYEKLKLNFLSATNVLFDTYKDLQVKRLGLRYINEIDIKEPNPLEWDKWLNKKYLYPFSKFPDKEYLSRTFDNLEFNYDNYNLRINFGLNNPDYPARIKKKKYVLDFDAYTSDLLTKDDFNSTLDIFHNKIEYFFELLITDSLRDKMK